MPNPSQAEALTVSDSAGSSLALGSAVGVVESLSVLDASTGVGGALAGFKVQETGLSYTTLQAAVNAASAGNTILGTPGTYSEWNVTIPKALTIKSSVPGSKVVMDAIAVSAPGGGSILSTTSSLTLEDFELKNNKFQYNYNAGFGTGGPSGTITLRRCKISECSNGFFTADNDTTAIIVLENSEFSDNGDSDGLRHNIYVGHCASLTMRGCWSHMTKDTADYPAGEPWRRSDGHLVKARAQVVDIQACRLTMEKGAANRCVDVPNGGDLTLQGNWIEYRTPQNNGSGQVLTWGVEGANRLPGTTYDGRAFNVRIRQNTIVARSDFVDSTTNRDCLWIGVGCDATGIGWSNPAPMPAPTVYDVRDNIFVGWLNNPPRVIEGPSATASTTYAISNSTNTVGALSLLTDAANYNYAAVTPVAGSQNWAVLSYVQPTSTTARVDAYRGGVLVPGWGAGATTGSYASNTWTPGRDGTGLVNQVSWDLVPSGQWSKVAGTSIFNMDAAVKAINSSWQDYGNNGSNWEGAVLPWTGCAKDPANSRMWFTGGGHADSSNNGLYRFDGYKMAWAIENMPSDTTAWSSGYKAHNSGSTFTLVDESQTATRAKYNASTLAAINDVAYDELYWDGKPAARHTYNSLVFCPDRNEIAMACRRLWTYSLTSGTWNYKRLFNDELSSALIDGSNIRWGEDTFACYDETTGEVLASAYGSSGTDDNASFNLRTKTWGAWTAPAAHWASGAMVRNGRDITYVRFPGSGGGGAEYRVYNLDSRTNTTSSTTWTLGSGVGDFRTDLYLPTLIYVPSINRYWFCAALNASTNMVWHEINPTTTPWTMNLKTFTGSVPTPPKAVGGSFTEPGGKHMFVPSMNAILYFFRGQPDDMYVYKL